MHAGFAFQCNLFSSAFTLKCFLFWQGVQHHATPMPCLITSEEQKKDQKSELSYRSSALYSPSPPLSFYKAFLS